MTTRQGISKKIFVFFLIIIFILLGWLKWSSLQNQTEMEPIKEPRWLLFHSTECEACEKMLALSSKLKDEYKDRVEFIHIDIYDESNEKISDKYNIAYIPTSVFEVGGKEPIRHIGSLPEDELREILDNMVKENE